MGDPETKPPQTIRTYKDLRVYQAAIDAAMQVFELTKRFPSEERYSMVDQNAEVVQICLREYWRSVAQATLSRTLCQQAERL